MDQGNPLLWLKIARKAYIDKSVIMVGGNEIREILIPFKLPVLKKDYTEQPKMPINLSTEEQDGIKKGYYDWHGGILSPDGSLLVATLGISIPNRSHLFLFNWNCLKKNKNDWSCGEIILPEYDIEQYAWSPNSKTLLLTAKKYLGETKNGNPSSAYFYNIPDRKLTELNLPNFQSMTAHAWSKNNQIVYEGPENFVSVYNVEKGTSNKLVSGAFPTWNSSGTQITYQELRDDLKNPYYLINPDGTGKQKLNLSYKERATPRSFYGPITWSPDDKYFIYGKQTWFKGTGDTLHVREVSSNAETYIGGGDYIFVSQPTWIQSK
jgi:hypothetical protein